MKGFGARLSLARKKKGLTQGETARRLGMSRSGYASYESDAREPSLAVLREICCLLDTTANYLTDHQITEGGEKRWNLQSKLRAYKN